MPQRHHVHRRRQGHPPLPRLSDRAACGEEHVSRDRLPAAPWRAADGGGARRVGLSGDAPHDHPRKHQEVHRRLSSRRPPDGDVRERGGRAVDVLSRSKADFRGAVAEQSDRASHREDAHAGRLRAPALGGNAVCVSRQRSELHRQFSEHDVQDHGGEVHAPPRARAGPGRAVHPARRSRAELLDQRHAWRRLIAPRPLLVHGGGGRGALWAVARRRQRGSVADAARDRLDRRDPGLHPARQEGGAAPDGIWPSRVQELRPPHAGLRAHREALKPSSKSVTQRRPAEACKPASITSLLDGLARRLFSTILGGSMPTYVLLSNLTDEGAKSLKANPKRLQEVNKEIEKFGAKVTAQYAVLGPYDFVSIVDCPDNETIARVSVELGSRGSIRLMTLAATPVANFIRTLRTKD